jgi:hypothetical protein
MQAPNPAGHDVTCSAARCVPVQDTTAEQRAEWRQLGLQLLAQVLLEDACVLALLCSSHRPCPTCSQTHARHVPPCRARSACCCWLAAKAHD